MTDAEDLALLRAEFGGWHIWRGGDLWYARLPRAVPPLTLRAEDPDDFRHLIPEELGRRRDHR